MTSTDDLSQIQVASANGSSSDNNKTNSDSSRITTYEDLVQDSNLFWEKLRDFLGYTDKPLTVPTVEGKSICLHKLFKEVTARRGLERVIKDRKCSEVIATFGLKTPITNASLVLKKHYVPMLFKFEHVYYLKKPASSFAAREEELSGLLGKSANHDNALQAGTAVDVIIEGKFNNGYFVRVKMDSKELKGVVYRLESPSRKKKSKSDPKKPKSHRSGYNFFYSENYERLRPHFVGKGQLLTQTIGKMWRSLSKSDREVYQEKGRKDTERSRKEISEYRSLMASRAATDAAAAAETAVATDAAMNDETDESESDAAMNDAATASEEAE
ncbi:unnamed protein product [Arabis nemorensis]|uniref:HMG box domain-containing protein n=1 Tax=Arabis nemorensis TaxID=586526 RepID=A0A565BF05_9BRAS|nr:unnamed protein product [Arabis nemorensis]